MTSAPIHHSVSTWRQPTPAPASAERSRFIAEIAGRAVRLGEGRLRIGIDGRTGAGKTTFGHELAGALAALGRPVLRASLDDFKRPWRERHLYDRESGEGYYRNAFDYDRFRRLLLDPFSVGKACALCAIDPITQIDHADALTEVASDAVLIVDGVFALRPELTGAWDLSVWVDIDAAESIARALARDGEGTRTVITDRYKASEEIYLAEADPRARADVVVDNSEIARPRVC